MPPLLQRSNLYSDRKKKIEIWDKLTTLEDAKKGAAVLHTLESLTEEVLELDATKINAADGLKNVTERLDHLYLKDTTLNKFQALEAFDSYTRSPTTSIQEHIHQFDKLYFKLHSHGTTISEDLLAYKFLKSANLSPQDKNIAKGTTTELTLSTMKTHLKKIFLDSTSLSTLQSTDTIKVCDTNETHLAPNHQDSLNTYSHRRGSYPQSHPAYRPQWHQPRPPSYQSSPPVMYPPAFSNRAQGQNPHNEKGEITQCSYCHSINHY